VRWRHPERGLIPPSDFIPMAEETNLILPIGAWVLREACEQARRWQLERPSAARLVMGVNLSARQLAQPSFADEVAEILRSTELPPDCLRLEITESTAMQDTTRTVTALEDLRALGVEIAIDDFGTGYSSLSYLRSLPTNVLKIDRTFVNAAATDASAMAIVHAIIAVAHALDMQVTAEGIETAAQLHEVTEALCDRGQGFHLARPLPVEQFEALLRGSEFGRMAA
jgi:EAL domain-containing protein (putative c-di-GMP-specific phosphodiesterase class I)